MKEEWEKTGNYFDYFEFLGVSEDASNEEIKKAYRDLAKKYHTDNSDKDVGMFHKATTAYETLTDKVKREKYMRYRENIRRKTNNANKEKEESESNTNKQDSVSFEDVVNEYQKQEYMLFTSIRIMLIKLEEKYDKFNKTYKDFCSVVKNLGFKESEYELRRQALYTFLLSSLNSISDIQKIMKDDLRNINFADEKKKLEKLYRNFKECEEVLSSSYKDAAIKLNIKIAIKEYFNKLNKKKMVATFSTVALLSIAGCYIVKNDLLSNVSSIFEEDESDILEKDILESEEKIEFDTSPIVIYPLLTKEELEGGYYDSECPLFEEPESDDFDYTSWVKSSAYVDVIEKSIGVDRYLYDARKGELLFGNYIIYNYVYVDGECVYNVLGRDGNYYVLDGHDPRRILKVTPRVDAYSSLESFRVGSDFVIETKTSDGKNILLDSSFEYPIIEGYDNYTGPFYSEDYGCDVVCFTAGDVNVYVDKFDLTEVIGVEKDLESAKALERK